MTVHIFGAKSSPSVANFALLQTAQDNAHHFNDEVLETTLHPKVWYCVIPSCGRREG